MRSISYVICLALLLTSYNCGVTSYSNGKHYGVRIVDDCVDIGTHNYVDKYRFQIGDSILKYRCVEISGSFITSIQDVAADSVLARIEYLKISNHDLTVHDIDSLIPHDSLKQLEVIHSGLKDIKSIVDRGSKLNKLYLYGNDIREIAGISKLKHIETLDVGENNLRKFPMNICDLHKLEYLNVSDQEGKVLDLPLCLCDLEHLSIIINDGIEYPTSSCLDSIPIVYK